MPFFYWFQICLKLQLGSGCFCILEVGVGSTDKVLKFDTKGSLEQRLPKSKYYTN